jgi:hypothetical protein
LPLCVKHSGKLVFADDATLTNSGKDIDVIENELSEDVGNVKQWCVQNDMVLSIPKCNALLLSTKQKHLHSNSNKKFVIHSDNTNIPTVDSTKILGVHFDQFMTWNDHIKHVHNQISRNLYLLKQIKSYLPPDSRKMFYNSYLLPYFDYCCVIWGNCTKTLLDDLLKLQKRAARLMLDVSDITTSSQLMFSELEWMPLPDRISYHRSVEVFKCLKTECPSELETLFEYNRNIHNHNTRAAEQHKLYIPKKHLKSCSYLGASTWNSIPLNIRSSNTITGFKRMYKNHYFIQ